MAAKSQNYKQLKDELDEIIAKLQSSDLDLDEAITLHSKGEKILAKIETYLADVAKDVQTEQ